jgi:hypothetical protein
MVMFAFGMDSIVIESKTSVNNISLIVQVVVVVVLVLVVVVVVVVVVVAGSIMVSPQELEHSLYPYMSWGSREG